MSPEPVLYPKPPEAQTLPTYAEHLQALEKGALAAPADVAAQLAWRDAQIAHLTSALNDRTGSPFQVTVTTYRESCGTSYLVNLVRPDRAPDAKPWDPGVWTFSQTSNREQADEEANSLRQFMDLGIPLDELDV